MGGFPLCGAQGFPGTLGTSINFEHTTVRLWPSRLTPAVPGNQSKTDWHPGTEVEAEPRVSSRLEDRLHRDRYFQVSAVQVFFPGVGLNVQGVQHRNGGVTQI